MKVSFLVTYYNQKDSTINTAIDTFKEEKLWLDFGISTENGGKYLNEGLISQKGDFAEEQMYTKCGN